MGYDLKNGLLPFPLSFLASDGGLATTPFVIGDKSLMTTGNNWFVLCLTPQEMTDLLSVIDMGAPIALPDSYAPLVQKYNQLMQFPNQIPEDSCMPLCDLILACINSSSEIQQAIGAYSLTSSIETDTPEQQGLLDTDLFADQGPCDNDEIFGMTVQLADFLNQVSEDILELFVTAFAIPGRLGDLIEAIPVVGLLPFDDILQFIEKMAEQVNDAYQAGYTVQVGEDISCDLFCIAEENCELTLEQARDYFEGKIVASVTNDDFLKIVNDIIANNWLGLQSVYVMHWFILDTVIFGGEVLGLDVNRIVPTIASYFNDPNSDWSTLCTSCAWEHTFDFTEDDGGFVDDPFAGTIGGNYIADTGWSWTDVQIQAGSNWRSVAIKKEFDLSDVVEVILTFDFTEGSPYTPMVTAQRIQLFDGVTVEADETIAIEDMSDGDDQILTLEASVEADQLSLFLAPYRSSTSNYDGDCLLTSVTVKGTGTNPFA